MDRQTSVKTLPSPAVGKNGVCPFAWLVGWLLVGHQPLKKRGRFLSFLCCKLIAHRFTQDEY